MIRSPKEYGAARTGRRHHGKAKSREQRAQEKRWSGRSGPVTTRKMTDEERERLA